MSQTYSINDFKAKCFDICKQVVIDHQEVVLNKYGKPFVRVIPYQTQCIGKLGALQGTAIMLDDLIAPSTNDLNQTRSSINTDSTHESEGL